MTKTGRLKVAIGPIFEDFGGVSQHILAIQKFSSHRISPIAPEFIRTVFGKRACMYMSIVRRFGLHGYDIVHSHVDPSFVNLCLLSRTTACKWVHTYHTLYFEEDYPGGLASWQKEINKVLIETASKADAKISVCKWLHDYLNTRYSIQTEMIPNGVDLEACDMANQERFLKRYGFDDFVLFTGGAQTIKNPQLFVKLAASIPNTKFVMIGRKLDPIVFNEWGLPVPKNLSLLGEMKHENVLDAMSACKAFVITSKRESGPIALLEAMALGKPVVVPDHSGCKEIVASEENGFLYEPNSLDDLVEQTRQALISTCIGKRARERVARLYDWRVLSKRIDLLYESIASSVQTD